MQTLQRLLALAIVASLPMAPALATAQPSSRAARLLTLGPDVPAVLVGSDRAWFPSADGAPLALCAGDRCAPVVEVTTCAPPQCPGTGSVARAERSVADVGAFPTDREGFGREVERLRVDPGLATLAWAYGTHPEPPPGPPEPAQFAADGHRGLRWELDALAIGGGLGVKPEPLVGAEVAGGVRWAWETHNDEDELLMVMFGNVIGADLRVRALSLTPSQGGDLWTVSIGVAPSFTISPEGESYRLPSAYATILPELGVILREDMNAAFYAGWTLPFAFLVDAHFGVEARATVLLIDDWIVGDDPQVLLTMGLGFIVR